MKIILSEKYGRLASWMRKLPAQGVCGEVLRDDRNTLWCERVAGEEFVVKRFAVPLRLNRWVYTFFRPTKARRSYDYSLRLRRSGIAVADPVGYIECRRGLLFHTGYYVSKRLPYPTLQQLDREPQARQFEISMPLRPSPSASTKRVCSITTTIRATSSITGRTVRGISR